MITIRLSTLFRYSCPVFSRDLAITITKAIDRDGRDICVSRENMRNAYIDDRRIKKREIDNSRKTKAKRKSDDDDEDE